MVDRRGQLRLVQEAVTERFVLGEAGGKQLQRDLPLEPQILGQVDDAHPAPAQQRLDPVAGELGADPRVVAHLHVRILAFGGPAGTIGRLGRICTGRWLQRGFRRVTPRLLECGRIGTGHGHRPGKNHAAVPELRVRRDELAVCELVEGERLHERLGEGEAQLLVERFSLSTNNVTYAIKGEELGYWRLFPAPLGWGVIPAWGHARVVGSRAPSLPEGQRVFGLVPTGTYFTVRPAAHPLGFVDAASHRAELARTYNRYLTVAGEDNETALVMRPLFVTSVLLDLLLSEMAPDRVQTVVLTSASSKTAYGLAHLLSERPVQTIGLTSAGRLAWVGSLELYDAVLAYDDLHDLRTQHGAVFVDFAGDGPIVRKVHEQLGETLTRSILVGFTHSQAKADQEPLPGPAPEVFFAPDDIARRGRELGQRYAAAWERFAPIAERTVRIERVTDGDQLVRLYLALLEGTADPAAGYVVSLDPARMRSYDAAGAPARTARREA